MPDGERRLAAVMFTDMVGYTSLAQRDEALSLSLLDEQSLDSDCACFWSMTPFFEHRVVGHRHE